MLAALGVNIEADVACVESCLDELGICFCFAPLLHKAMKHVAPVRKKLATPTVFNILGPLVNPAAAPFQLLGVGHAGSAAAHGRSTFAFGNKTRGHRSRGRRPGRSLARPGRRMSSKPQAELCGTSIGRPPISAWKRPVLKPC